MTEQNKPGWMSLQGGAELLLTAENLAAIEFYVTKSDNRSAELHCRCPGLPAMSEEQIAALADELNSAIAKVALAHKHNFAKKAANQRRRFL